MQLMSQRVPGFGPELENPYDMNDNADGSSEDHPACDSVSNHDAVSEPSSTALGKPDTIIIIIITHPQYTSHSPIVIVLWNAAILTGMSHTNQK